MIEVRDLVKKYGDHIAVDHLSFSIKKGGIYGFLGPNGAGKSTTMNIITGYIVPTEGEVIINGHNILDEPEEAKKCIGYLPEQPPLYSNMTVYEYLSFVSELKKIPGNRREEMIDQVVELVQLDDMQGRLIRNLSKGYKQRVGLAQAILGFPRVIILDEPTVGLDPKQIIEIRALIRELGKEHTIILSSHILSEISAVCDYVMIMSGGRLVASDSTEQLSKLSRGMIRLEVTLLGSQDRIRQILSDIKGIKHVQYHPISNKNEVSVTIETEDTTDIREELFYRMAEGKCPILKLTFTKHSLEEVFLALTGEDKGEADREENMA